MPLRLRTVLLSLVVALAPPAAPRASAVGYDFVVLASSLRPVFPQLSFPPSIDDTGAVAFIASASGGDWVLVAEEPAGVVLTDYLVIDGEVSRFITSDSPGLGTFTDGWVAYGLRVLDEPGSGYVARGNGDLSERIYTIADGEQLGPPAVSPDGELVHVMPDRTLVVIQDDVPTVLFQLFQMIGADRIDDIRAPAPDIDDIGRVAFFASFSSFEGPTCDDKVLLSGPAVPTQLAEGGVLLPGCPFFNIGTTIPLALNDVGQVAFTGTYEDSFTEEFVDALYVDGNVVWDERIPGFPGLFFFDAVALNDSGTVAFTIDATDGRHLYVGSDPVEDAVLAVGDALCEGTVTEIHFDRYGLNDANELALGVVLADGRRLIVRAEPSSGPGGECIRFPVPEPQHGLGATAAIAALALRKRCRS